MVRRKKTAMIGDGWCQKYGMIIIVFYGWSIKGVVEPCCQAKLKGKKIVFQNKNTFNGYRQHIDMHCPASHSQNSIGFVLPSCCRSVGSGGPRGLCPPPPVFGTSVNPISTGVADYAHHNTTCSTGFSDLPTAL